MSPDNTPPHPWRRPLLIVEFAALAVLIGSMLLLGRLGGDGDPISRQWLLIPAAASLAVFISFLGLMYLRWIDASGAGGQTRHKVVFALLTLTLLGVWAFGIANTWNSLQTP